MSVTFLVTTHCDRPRIQLRNAPAPSGTAADQYDVSFIDMMIRHHQHAVELWKVAAGNATHRELRQFATAAIREQEREILLMRMWRDKWFHGERASPAAPDAADVHLSAPQGGADFDRAFLAMMIPHHQRAAAMAGVAVERTSTPELRQLAQIIRDQQEDEVSRMSVWQRAWSSKYRACASVTRHHSRKGRNVTQWSDASHCPSPPAVTTLSS